LLSPTIARRFYRYIDINTITRGHVWFTHCGTLDTASRHDDGGSDGVVCARRKTLKLTTRVEQIYVATTQ
jgi:hypothetical protein